MSEDERSQLSFADSFPKIVDLFLSFVDLMIVSHNLPKCRSTQGMNRQSVSVMDAVSHRNC